MIRISETFIKKQSREYAIDSIGLPALLTIDANSEGTYNQNVPIVEMIYRQFVNTLINIAVDAYLITTVTPNAFNRIPIINSSIIQTVLLTDIKIETRVQMLMKNIVNTFPKMSSQLPHEYEELIE